MAKNGTLQGGMRPGAGRKRKSLDEKILDGKDATFIPTGEHDFSGVDASGMPPAHSFMKAKQAVGKKLNAEEIYKNTYLWLKTLGCEQLVSQALIEQYAMMYARYIACEEQVSKEGYCGMHPTTGAPIPSPFVRMSVDYAKQANIAWNQIYQIVKENASENYLGNPSDEMEILLRKKKK